MYQCINVVLVSDCICMANMCCLHYTLPIILGVPMVCRDISIFTRLTCYVEPKGPLVSVSLLQTHVCTSGAVGDLRGEGDLLHRFMIN